jgi:uncharacterized membrane protein YedE/YeeE
MEQFAMPLVGGLMLGVASIILLAAMGRIAGVSGITWGALSGPDRAWRWLFVVGIVLGTVIAHQVTGLDNPLPHEGGWLLAVSAGLLVGVGTRVGSGCTSGHGVCGIGRLSGRSIAATLTFMATGVITVFVVRHMLGGAL